MSPTEFFSQRIKASVRPSGESSGSPSPHAEGGGEVNLRFRPSCRDSEKIAAGFWEDSRSEINKESPSGDQATTRESPSGAAGAIDVTLRFAPPRAGTVRISMRSAA